MSFKIRVITPSQTTSNLASLRGKFPKLLKAIDSELNHFGNSIVRRSKLAYLSHRSAKTLGVVTGRLRASINYQKLRGTLGIEVGTNVEYGPTHEFGLSIRRKGGGTTKMPERPFILPAILDEEDKFVSRLNKVMVGLYGE